MWSDSLVVQTEQWSFFNLLCTIVPLQDLLENRPLAMILALRCLEILF